VLETGCWTESDASASGKRRSRHTLDVHCTAALPCGLIMYLRHDQYSEALLIDALLPSCVETQQIVPLLVPAADEMIRC
jgi:hypothetical protein